MSKIRILLIEDNRLLREGISAMINEQVDMKVVAALAGHTNTLLNARSVRARVILVDLSNLHMAAPLAKKNAMLKKSVQALETLGHMEL